MSTFRLDFPEERCTKRGISPLHWGVLINTTFPTANTADAILAAWDLAKLRNLDVFAGHVAIVVQNRKVDNQWISEEACWLTSKALVAVAHKTGSFAGIDALTFGPLVDHKYSGHRRKDGGANEKADVVIRAPEYAIATVYRFVAGQRCAFSETVFFNEIVPLTQGIPTPTWQKKPTLMLAKCTKAAALRIGFSECDYSSDEMDGQTVVPDLIPNVAETGHNTSGLNSGDAQMPTQTTAPAFKPDDQVFGEAITDFAKIPASTLKWLDRNVDTAINLGAFDDAVDNMQRTQNADVHHIGERLIRAAETISSNPHGPSILTYIGQARDHGRNAFDQAIAQIDKQAEGGRLPKDVAQASATVLTFLKALDAA